jgi:hypothetical protein
MRHPFKAVRGGVQVNLDQEDRERLVELLEQLDALLDDGLESSADPLAAMVGISGIDSDGPAPTTPEDPALARLLPDGNRDDPEAAAEYRRLTEYGLRARKRSGARLAAGALARPEPVILAAEEGLALMKSFTDVRLVLGERLELKTDEDAEELHDRLWAGEGEPYWLVTAAIYEQLTIWQDYLITAVEKLR